MNEWRLDVEKWMNPATVEVVWGSKDWRRISKSAFSTYLQHLSGCKFLLRSLIALPIISDPAQSSFAQPGSSGKLELLRQLAREWTEYRRTPDHQAAVKRSQPSDKARLSQRVHPAQTRYKEGAKLSRQVAEGTVDYKYLDKEKQSLVEEYDTRISAKALDAVLAEHAARPPKYRGAGIVLEIPAPPRAEQPEL